MRDRITRGMIQRQLDYLNSITNSPATPYGKDKDGRLIAHVGNFHLSRAYGGCCIHRMHNEGGGVSTPIPGVGGHIPMRECYDKLRAFIAGIDFTRNGS